MDVYADSCIDSVHENPPNSRMCMLCFRVRKIASSFRSKQERGSVIFKNVRFRCEVCLHFQYPRFNIFNESDEEIFQQYAISMISPPLQYSGKVPFMSST